MTAPVKVGLKLIPQLTSIGELRTVWQVADEAGFDHCWVYDHFLPASGAAPEGPVFDGWELLAAMAVLTERTRVGVLVTGNTYRHPSLLAKTVTALDVVSGGRAQLGIGAGWFEFEHQSLGFEFGTFTDRFEKLEEALNIIKPMLAGENPTFKGKHYHVENAMNNPRIRPAIPIMLGGSGEKKTFRLAAHFADHMNIICDLADVPKKLAALRQRCEEAGRDPSTLPTSYLASIFVAENEAEVKSLNELIPEARRARAFVGLADQVAEQIKENILDQGIDGVCVNMIINGHVPGRVTLAGEALRPLVS